MNTSIACLAYMYKSRSHFTRGLFSVQLKCCRNIYDVTNVAFVTRYSTKLCMLCSICGTHEIKILSLNVTMH